MSLPLFVMDKLARMQKSKRLKVRKPSLTSLKKKLWALLAPKIREKYGPNCFTCGRPGNQAGHMFPNGRAHALSAFMPANIRVQCFSCNINLGGNGATFARLYRRQYGDDQFEMVARASMMPHKWTAVEVETLISKIKVSLEHYEAFYMAYFRQEE